MVEIRKVVNGKAILPADIYDALELSALAAGGIGAPDLYDNYERACPQCIYGHVEFTGAPIGFMAIFRPNPLGPNSDEAVEAINRRKGRRATQRVTFREWCKETRVVRGD